MKVLSDRLQQNFFTSQVGRDCQVLREAQVPAGHPGDLFGYTPNYLPVRVDPSPAAAAVGEILDVTIRGIDPDAGALRGSLSAPVRCEYNRATIQVPPFP
jgi:threonylcarbamoyladenosine tRNA methylthiotransferase MtaB